MPACSKVNRKKGQLQVPVFDPCCATGWQLCCYDCIVFLSCYPHLISRALLVLSLSRPVTRGGSGGSYEPPHGITRSGFLICDKLLFAINSASKPADAPELLSARFPGSWAATAQSYHVLHKYLPDKTDHTYNLRSRHHSLSLTVKTDWLQQFPKQTLFKDIY